MKFIKICMGCGAKSFFRATFTDTDKELCEDCYQELKYASRKAGSEPDNHTGECSNHDSEE